MDIDIKIYIRDDSGEPFFGKGPSELLKNIDECGSIRKAAGNMEMSYSKAHGLIKAMEKQAGKKLLEKETGGAGGGGAELTPAARRLIDEYEQMEKDIKDYAEQRFKKFKIK